jgi:hypothetical protein
MIRPMVNALSAIERATRRADQAALSDCRRSWHAVHRSYAVRQLRASCRRLAAALRLQPQPRPRKRPLTGAQAMLALQANMEDPYADED